MCTIRSVFIKDVKEWIYLAYHHHITNNIFNNKGGHINIVKSEIILIINFIFEIIQFSLIEDNSYAIIKIKEISYFGGFLLFLIWVLGILKDYSKILVLVENKK